MSTRQITHNRRQSRPSRINRSTLAVRCPPPVLCFLSFLISAALPIGGYVIAIYPLTSIQQYSLIGMSALATLYCLVGTMKKRRSGQPIKKIRNYAMSGLIAGCLIAAIGYSVEAMAAKSTQHSQVILDDNVPICDLPNIDGEGDDLSSSNGKDFRGTVVDLEEGADGLKTGSNIFIEDEKPQSEEKKFTPPSKISAAKPVVLKAGTRLELLSSKRDEIRLRLEEKDDKFVTGLSKTDFRILSKGDVELNFKIVEMPEKTIAVRSNISIIVDESLSVQTQKGACVSAIETILQASAYSGYKLSAAGASIRTLSDWTSAAKNVESATSRFRQSYGGNLQASVSLNTADLAKQPSRRILLLFLSSRSLQNPLTNEMQTRFARADITTLVVTDDSRTANRLDNQQGSVRFFSFGQLRELQDVVQRLTTRREPPSYLIRSIEPHRSSSVRLVVGSGDSAVTAVLEPSAGLVSFN